MTVLVAAAAAYAYLLVAGMAGALAYRVLYPGLDKWHEHEFPYLHRDGSRPRGLCLILAALIGLAWPLAIPVVFGVRRGLRVFVDTTNPKVDA